MTRIAYVSAGGETVDLTSEEADRLLARDPELRREYAKWSAISGGRGGRMIVLDGERVRRVLADDAGPQGVA